MLKYLLSLLITLTVLSSISFGKIENKICFDDTIKFRIIDVPSQDTNYFKIIEKKVNPLIFIQEEHT